MCSLSMVVDQGRRDLEALRQQWPQPLTGLENFNRDRRMEEIERRVKALEDLMAAAKKYDDETGQPDCETAEKKEALRVLAEKLGIPIHFPE